MDTKCANNCCCIGFTFYNKHWFNSKLNILIAIIFILPITFVSNQTNQLKPWLLCLGLLLSCILLAKTLFSVVTETLNVIIPIGVQFISTSFLGKKTVAFIPWHAVINFVIVEVIVGQQVFFYLAIQTLKNDKEGLVILFEHTRPRLLHLERMYKIIINHKDNNMLLDNC